MGEEPDWQKGKTVFIYCHTNDIGTDREVWGTAELKNIRITADKGNDMSVANWDVPKSFTLSFSVPEGEFKISKRIKGRRHYVRKTIGMVSKAVIRKSHLHMKKFMFGRKRHRR